MRATIQRVKESSVKINDNTDLMGRDEKITTQAEISAKTAKKSKSRN